MNNVGKIVSEAIKKVTSKVANQKLITALVGLGDFVGDAANTEGTVDTAGNLPASKISSTDTNSANDNLQYSKQDATSLVNKIIGADEQLSAMPTAAKLSGSEFPKSEVDLITQVTEFFNSLKNKVRNSVIGDVILSRDGAKSSLGHGMGRKKAIAYAAVPDVIEKGKIIDYQKDWKDRGYDTVVIAAPIEISGELHHMGVVVNKNAQDNKYYLHEVVLKEKSTESFKTGPNNSETIEYPSDSVLYDNNITQFPQNINTPAENSTENISTNAVPTFETQQQAPASAPTAVDQQIQPAATAPQETSIDGEKVDTQNLTEYNDEIDEEGNPVFEVIDNRKPIEPIDRKLLNETRKQANEKYGLSEELVIPLKTYVMTPKLINTKLNQGNLSESDQSYIKRLIGALRKFPPYEGRTYRNLKFANEHEYHAFLEKNTLNTTVTLKAFTSTSKRPNGYSAY